MVHGSPTIVLCTAAPEPIAILRRRSCRGQAEQTHTYCPRERAKFPKLYFHLERFSLFKNDEIAFSICPFPLLTDLLIIAQAICQFLSAHTPL